jgi:hypothetical protein
MTEQKDLFTKRFRKVPAPDPSELQIHISLVERLRLQCRKDVLFFHCPNGELRDKAAAAKLKAMGVLPGVSDLQFIWTQGGQVKVLFLELKAKGRKLRDEQVVFGFASLHVGCAFEVADTIDDAVKILQKYHIIP